MRKATVNYQEKRNVKVRLFFSKKDNDGGSPVADGAQYNPVLHSRDYTEVGESNDIQFKIEPSGSYLGQRSSPLFLEL